MRADQAADVRTYRFAPLDRTGVLLGLSGVQCALLAAGIVLSSALLQAGGPLAVVAVPMVAAGVVAFSAWNGRPVHEVVRHRVRYHALVVAGFARWPATGRARGAKAGRADQRVVPPFLAGLELLDAGQVGWLPSAEGIGVVHDLHRRTLSASLPVHGCEFSLLERADQERVVDRWGDVLSGFCTERGAVRQVRVTEWAAPAGVEDHRRYLSLRALPANPAAVCAYEQVLDRAGPITVRHEVLVTITVDLRRLRRSRTGRTEANDQVGVDAIVEELRLLANRLDGAGMGVGSPLTTHETAVALRLRLDPSPLARRAHGRPVSLAEAVGAATPGALGPGSSRADWEHLTVDGSVHRTYWISEWPRLDVGPNWFEPVLLHPTGGARTVSWCFEPVSPARSQRRIDRDSTRLAADEEQRTRHGFRITVRHRRAQSADLEREAELVAGNAELEYAGFVSVTAPSVDALARCATEFEQTAAQAGLQLRPLDGRHDLGVVCALPVGRGVAPRRLGA